MEVSHAAHTKLNFTLSQREGDSCEIPITDYDIQFREVDFSSFILLSSPLDLVDTNDPSTVSLRVCFVCLYSQNDRWFFIEFVNELLIVDDSPKNWSCYWKIWPINWSTSF